MTPSNAAILYAESVVHMRTPQDVIEAIANAYDSGAHSRNAEVTGLTHEIHFLQRRVLKEQRTIASMKEVAQRGTL